MSAEGPKSYPVVYDPDLGLQYSYQSGYLAITIPPSTDITVADINSEAATNGQALTANGSGGATWTSISAAPGGTDTQVQFNNSGSFGASANLTYNGNALTVGSTPGSESFLTLQGDSVNGGQLSLNNSQVGFQDQTGATLLSTVYMNGTALAIALVPNGADHEWNFTADGGLIFPGIAAEPGSPVEGEIIYNSTSHQLEVYNGTSWTRMLPIAVLSAATVGGAAAEEVAVAGLLTTSTILAVTQQVAGGAALPLTEWTNVLDGSLNVTYSADMGPGARVLVYFIP
jgi:hypothetical protein